MNAPSYHLRLKSLTDCPVKVTQLKTDEKVQGGFRMKQMKDGHLWLTSYNEIHVFKSDASDRQALKKVQSFSAPIKDAGAICTFTDSFCSPVVALHETHVQDTRPSHYTKHGLIQIDYNGKLDCVISGGPFSHVTASHFEPRLISAIRGYKEVSFYTYDERNNGNKWLHLRDLFFKKEYSRQQLGKDTMLLGGKDGTHIDEINLLSGDIIRTIPNSTPNKEGMYLCCSDDEETAVVADLPNGTMYILEKGKVELTRIQTNTLIHEPHDATIFNDRLLVVDSRGDLFELEPQSA